LPPLPKIHLGLTSRNGNLRTLKGKQEIQGQKTSWEIDAKGVAEDGKGFFIVECRRYTRSKQSQEKAAALASKISVTGAVGGIIVSPFGVQKGAQKLADAENIISVKLNADSTPTEFALQFLNKLCLGISAKATSTARVSPRYLRQCAKCGKKFEVLGDRLLCNNRAP
jgi:hypothetical protein